MSKRRCREELPVSTAANFCSNPVCAVILLIILQKTCLLENNNAFLLILIFIACCCCKGGNVGSVANRPRTCC
ncbi:hypothetical protein LGK97_13235 [Clostridium sp. CS001]|uniref:hypothetical protein n=1 Tax=Clostridium sp. CS001 TaxID=2880648 RepID=UPI001CF20786|nr:hypothetical protein [Clostridium sp. CS001]MCB2290724.1 hypothetical protein [Clostridium sp. CS001]